uniref:Relaxin family peptide receptor 1 n=1 Tax=Rousettus aegyptiacus TaxID=9407 RepID=A0A7J8BV47_ROUAE|nr:relaxin family peptide receptor 1 [Rousettus aegyptiacus]
MKRLCPRRNFWVNGLLPLPNVLLFNPRLQTTLNWEQSRAPWPSQQLPSEGWRPATEDWTTANSFSGEWAGCQAFPWLFPLWEYHQVLASASPV